MIQEAAAPKTGQNFSRSPLVSIDVVLLSHMMSLYFRPIRSGGGGGLVGAVRESHGGSYHFRI